MELEDLIQTRPVSRSDLRVWYGQILEQADGAGLSTSELAARLGCSRETVYAWRRRLRGRMIGVDQPPNGRLVRVEVARPNPTASTETFEVRTRSGHAILVPHDFDSSALVSLIRVLEGC